MKKGLISVDGLKATTATFISGGEVISIEADNTQSNYRKLILPLRVIFEDDYLTVINKPAGILVSGNAFKTIDNALVQNLKLSTQTDACKPRPVHRLDYPTTGLLMVGKTRAAIIRLNQLFENKEIDKKYIAISIGKMSNDTGIILNEVDEKPAESHFSVLHTVDSKRFNTLNLVELSPKTGKRHQLRKHLAEIGNPVLGDKEYGKDGLILNGKGLYLHAISLEFEHPITQEKIIIKTELPERFLKIFPS